MKRIVILGAGESGAGAALLAKAKGCNVFVSDLSLISDKYKTILSNEGIDFEEGTHTEDLILNADEVVKSPGIPDKAPIIKKLKEKGTPIIGEIELAARYTKAKTIAITGSNGKTTTTLLTYHLLKQAGFNVGLGGNIGDSIAKQVIEDTFDYFVLELSSFQLDNLYQFKADVGMLLNITPDHLDRYEYKFENYVASKFRIAQNQTNEDYLIGTIDNEAFAEGLEVRNIDANLLLVSLENEVPQGAYLEGDKLKFLVGTEEFELKISDLPLQGRHNMANIASAVLGVEALKQKEGITSQFDYANLLANFSNAPHRLEKAGTVNGVKYINDSKATNVDSVFYALDAMTQPVIWIAGGVDKGNDYSQIAELVKTKVKTIISLGKDNTPLNTYFKDFGKSILLASSMEEAIALAHQNGENGDVVLLSPACASFDLFNNYEDRGEQFKLYVQSLKLKV